MHLYSLSTSFKTCWFTHIFTNACTLSSPCGGVDDYHCSFNHVCAHGVCLECVRDADCGQGKHCGPRGRCHWYWYAYANGVVCFIVRLCIRNTLSKNIYICKYIYIQLRTIFIVFNRNYMCLVFTSKSAKIIYITSTQVHPARAAVWWRHGSVWPRLGVRPSHCAPAAFGGLTTAATPSWLVPAVCLWAAAPGGDGYCRPTLCVSLMHDICQAKAHSCLACMFSSCFNCCCCLLLLFGVWYICPLLKNKFLSLLQNWTLFLRWSGMPSVYIHFHLQGRQIEWRHLFPSGRATWG